ncbi:hypothetical protein B0H19DRAFT_1055155 [Mycena capillaripes]|nr:hypothetical protein B0H19DRAFT_1055155 [Mycena capillaripes]
MWPSFFLAILAASCALAQVPGNLSGVADFEFVWNGEPAQQYYFGTCSGTVEVTNSLTLDTTQLSCWSSHPGVRSELTPWGFYHARMNGTIYSGTTALSATTALSNKFNLAASTKNCTAGTWTPVRSLTDPAYSPLRIVLPMDGDVMTQSSLSGPVGIQDLLLEDASYNLELSVEIKFLHKHRQRNITDLRLIPLTNAVRPEGRPVSTEYGSVKWIMKAN